MKECTKCHITKDLDKFPKDRSYCKNCKNTYERERRSKNRQKYRDLNKEHYKRKKAEKKIIETDITKQCTICGKNKHGTLFYKRPTGTLRSECKNCSSTRRKEYYQKNREKIIKQTSQYKQNKINTDITFKLEVRLRTRLYNALIAQDETKKQRTMKYVQCTPKILRDWMEYQLYDGMTMDNYGETWHMDHCKPCSMFDLSDPNQVYECFHWVNIRPYTVIKNLKKSASYNIYDSILQEIKAHGFVQTKGLKSSLLHSSGSE